MIQTNHKLDYCFLCEREMIVCATCGNNCCSATYGEINGENCKDCPDAYDIQDYYYNDPNSVGFPDKSNFEHAIKSIDRFVKISKKLNEFIKELLEKSQKFLELAIIKTDILNCINKFDPKKAFIIINKLKEDNFIYKVKVNDVYIYYFIGENEEELMNKFNKYNKENLND